MSPGRSATVRVVGWMSVAMLAFSTMALSIRGLAGALSIFEIMAVRGACGLAVLLVLVAAFPAVRPGLVPRRLSLHVLRNTLHFSAQYAWAVSVTLLPLATVFAIEFTSPAWAALFAVLLLGERLTPSRIGVLV